MIDLNGRMLLAVPKKGRLNEKSLEYLGKAGLKYRRSHRLDIALCSNLPLALIFLPAADIALYVGNGQVDMGITGQDVVAESAVQVDELLELGFGNCTLCLQAPAKHKRTFGDLVGGRIVTSFPELTKKYFADKAPDTETKVQTLSGSVEAACSLGLADGIVDLVESGETMKAAGLEVVTEIMKTQAVLIANPHSQHQDMITRIRKRLDGVVTADKFAMIEYNIHRDNMKAGEALTPGRKSPTISPLEDPNWVAVKSLIRKSESNNLIDQLDQIGATDILVYHLDNCRV